MAVLTEKAAAKFKELAAETEEPEKQVLRVTFVGMCCGGPTWHLSMDNCRYDTDMVAESYGVPILYSKKKEKRLEDAVIDYSDKWYNQGFYLKGVRTSTCPI
ncbi:MAG TPA: iron-sulfur cluster biosynthesis family protein [Petrimonas sp.]|nr:iron-sulfur cluster biosynthesis family protein [Petrimonas sp.]